MFEKYPRLQFVFKEYGVAWLPGLMWRLDDNYCLLRDESPWVKRAPSEYVREHVKLSTQPIEQAGRTSQGLVELLATIDGIEHMLCFSTDYPHGAMDEPGFVASQLPAAWLPLVFESNACASYGWPMLGHVSSLATDRRAGP